MMVTKKSEGAQPEEINEIEPEPVHPEPAQVPTYDQETGAFE